MQALREWVRRIPPVAALLAERDRLRRENRELQRANRNLRARKPAAGPAVHPGAEVLQVVPPGHFYSPIPDLTDVRARAAQIFDRNRADLPGIEVHAADQLALLEPFAALYAEQPFAARPHDGLRYGFANDYFAHGDGLALYSMLRHLRPGNVVEVGSGWSSALMLDVNERFLNGALHLTFIEPYPDRLNALLRPEDRARATVLDKPLHAVADSVFGDLGTGDLLFIDSTHVSRIGSDVNRLLLEVVPALPAGVHVHIHDIFWPFEYPEDWVYRGHAWNEAYLLRALLIGQPQLRITWFNHYLQCRHSDAVAAAMPMWANNPGGSIWLRTT
ncbi:MAG TPA: class I SAM-dependent methyltransferase [Sporichthyaceae bacterium]